jgi:hypothetical protein
VDSLSLVLDVFKWLTKKVAQLFGYQIGEFDQIIGAVVIFSLVVVLVGVLLRFYLPA